MRAFTRIFAQRGFTLVEAIVVIVITGIIAAGVAVFIRAPVEGYVDSVARAELTDAADTALRRLSRDVNSALPNSLRQGPGAACIEFLPALGGGRYRVAPRADGTGNILDFTQNDPSFDVLAQNGLPPTGGFGNSSVVVYNLGIPGANAYDPNDRNRAAINAGASNAGLITLAAANQFPFRSPGNRFQVIQNASVVYYCAGSAIWRASRALPAGVLAAPAACPQADFAGATVLVGNVDCAQSSFAYNAAVSQRNGILALTLVLTQPASRGINETISLYQEVQLDNTP
ncbi:MAG: prepilin-type N-terminal cleavage/methylation domain-containing protein [Propionivibrio sp.]